MSIYIDDVIDRLKDIRKKEGNIEICKVGHFGEINEMTACDISIYRNAREGTFGDGKERPVVDFCTPDIGPDPD